MEEINEITENKKEEKVEDPDAIENTEKPDY